MKDILAELSEMKHRQEKEGHKMETPLDLSLYKKKIKKEEKMEKAEGDEAKIAEFAKLHDGILKVWKQRRNGKRPRAKLWFDSTSKRFRTKQDDTPPPTIETAKDINEETLHF